jgi:hypothetical protein
MRRENSMIFSNDPTTKDALLNTLGDELAAAWVRFYAIEVDSRPGELEYDRALAAAKKLEAAFAKIVAACGGRPQSDWPFELTAPARSASAEATDSAMSPASAGVSFCRSRSWRVS